MQDIPQKSFEFEVVAPLLPRAFKRRPKAGFILPFKDWLVPDGLLAKLACARLQDENLVRQAGLSPREVRRKLNERRLPWTRRWSLVALLDWVARNGVAA
jgi:asparagine synthetase B (glutamine-hydrolysing)